MSTITTALAALHQAGITDTGFRSANLWLQELPDASALRLRSLQPEQWVASLEAQGLEAPVVTGGSVGTDPALLCLRPGEWLVFSDSRSSGQLLDRIQSCLPKPDSAANTFLLDASDSLAYLRVGGAAAPWLLAKPGSLDFAGLSRTGQYCARTRLGQVAAVVHYHPLAADPEEWVYDLLVDRSVASYLWRLLLNCTEHAEELFQGS